MTTRVMSSEYMYWAKTQSQATFDLANSGMAGYSLADLPVKIEDLEINGPSYYGYEPLLQALAAKCEVTTGNVVAANGASMVNFFVMAATLEPGDEVLIEHPTYELLVSTAQYVGAEVKRFSRRFENRFRIDVDEVAAAISSKTRLIVLTNLHNPSGAQVDQATLSAIGDIARDAKARVLVGEIYLDALFEETPRSAFHLGPQFVVTNSLTKVYGLSGLRCGWVVAEPDLAQKIWRLNDLIANSPAHVAERLSCIALASLDHIRQRSKRILTANHELLASFMAGRDDLEAVVFPRGTVCFPRLRQDSVDQLCARLREKYETAVVPGKFFGMPDHCRIGLGCKTDTFAEGIRRLGLALDESREQNGKKK
ncbi:MAG TPA: pyridoxal phosphate-dependent aminotransferase [Pyrinomonadaceae bacterium]|nr:pyridoxal phosphate-dependent aminotransferase [Pyrinomonadaceae bacterium]